MRRLLTWIVVIAILAGGVYLGSPYYSMYRLVQAARAGDAKTVASFVDFPAVRASLQPQLESYLQGEIAREQQKPHSIWDQLKLAVAPYIAGPATQLVITPQALAAIIRTARPPSAASVSALTASSAPAVDDKGPGDVRPVSYGYVGDDLDQFRAEIASRARPAAKVKIGMLRRGFFTWKVVSLDLSALPRMGSGRQP